MTTAVGMIRSPLGMRRSTIARSEFDDSDLHPAPQHADPGSDGSGLDQSDQSSAIVANVAAVLAPRIGERRRVDRSACSVRRPRGRRASSWTLTSTSRPGCPRTGRRAR